MAGNNTSTTQNNAKPSNFRCYTCFPYGTDTILCNEGVDDVIKFARKNKHPTDPIGFTLWLFNARVKCISDIQPNNIDKIKDKILQEFNVPHKQYNNVEFRDKVQITDTNKYF